MLTRHENLITRTAGRDIAAVSIIVSISIIVIIPTSG